MKGFSNAAHHTEFDEFVDVIGDVMPGCKLFKYGAGKGNNPKTGKPDLVTNQVGFGLELHQPGFYDLAFNPDDRLIQRLASEDRPVLSILITDGVYSEPAGSTSPPVVQAIQEWMASGRIMGIFMLKSAFDGPFYAERGRSFLPKLAVKARPFYAFVFSPTDKAFSDIQEKLQRRFPDLKTISFSNEAVSCRPSVNERLKGTYSYKKPPETSYHWQMFDSDLFAKGAPASVTYTIKCSVASDYPSLELRFAVAVDYYRWISRSFQKVGATPPGFRYDLAIKSKRGADAEPTKALEAGTWEIQSDVTAYFPKDGGGDYGFYHFRLTPATSEIRDDLRDLSTRDDRDPNMARRTYRFAELLSAITDVHFKTYLSSKTSPSIFVTIDNH